MRLVADRFVVADESDDALDLATGARVVLTIGSAGGVSEQLRWTARCDTWHALRHPAIAPLVDFGPAGESSRFEAWGCGSIWRGAREHAQAAHERAGRFLRAMSRSTGELARGSARIAPTGRVVWLPDAGSGYPRVEQIPHGEDDRALPLPIRGLEMVDRRAVTVLSEMLQATDARPRIATLWGAAGSGKRTVIRALARIARSRGFVPIAAHLLGPQCAEDLDGRTLFVIADGRQSTAWPSFLSAALRTSRPHAFVIVGEHEWRSVEGVAIERVPADALAAAVRPQTATPDLERAIRRAAERAHGLPGRFVDLLWHARVPRAVPRRLGLPRVAEQAAAYGQDEAAGALATPATPSSWPAPGELQALRRRVDGALAQIARGRHAAGLRELRGAIGGLARRAAWHDAAMGTVALAGALRRRGRPRDAQAAIEEGRGYAVRAGIDALLIDLATLGGEAWIDLARLDEAESVLSTAVAAARAIADGGDPARLAAASHALARCQFWRGQYVEAQATLGRSSPTALTCRVAIGLGDVSRAMETAATIADPAASAFVHLAVGDLDAAGRDVAMWMAAAHAGHDALSAIRARLVRADLERRRSRCSTAVAQLTRLGRVLADAPVTLRARWELAMALTSRSADPRETIDRHIAATGLGALGLFAHHRTRGSGSAGAPFADEIVAILQVCQTADEELVVLKDVCARVRQHLHAASVACVAVRGDRAEVLAADGSRLDTLVAQRAVAAGIAIAPHRHDDRVEAAAPVQYGGVVIGALCARWTIGSTYDTSHAAPALAMSAAAAAPMLAAALAKREQPAVAAPSELVGVTPIMIELRKSVDRAAAAPFAVLIDGESGSGKELVARAIHRGGGRRGKPFCTLNCAALPDDLIDAELFGHARGSFTGAIADRAGVFEEAHGGTLFLDEIGELSPRAQAKVLRVIQEGELRRVGETPARRVDVRIVCATNRDLRAEVEGGRFRLDLLYRLDVVHITVPPLRERREDIAVLAEHFWRDAAARVASRATLGAATLAALARYDWPGNVRELQNVLAALAVRSPRRGVVPPSALPAPFAAARGGDDWRLTAARRTFEERFVRAALARTGGHRGRAAAELGVTRQGLTKLMARLGIST